MKIFNSHIDFSSLFQKGIKPIKDSFGVYLITGYQGSGKTYFSIYLIYNFYKNKHIYTNIKSLKIKNANITYFEKLEEITHNIEEDCVFLIDEISRKYTKESKQDKDFYSWLQQSRKRKRTTFLITQEYLQVPQWLRGVAREVFTTTKYVALPVFKTIQGYAILNPETKDWEVQPQKSYLYKRTKKISQLYDTMEPIQTL